MIKILVTVCAVMGATVVGAQPVAPNAVSNLSRAQLGQVPKISDTLTVAKSPFEPVTLAVNSLNSPESSRDVDVLTAEELASSVDIKRTTRAIQEESELEQTQKPMANAEQPSSSTVEVTTTIPASVEADVTAAESETESTTTPKSVDLQRANEKATTTTITSSPAAESTSSSSSESASDSSNEESNNNESATTTVPELNLTSESSLEASTEKSATSTSTTEAPQTEAPKTSAPVSETSEEETSSSTTTTTTTTEAPASSSEPAAAEEPSSSSEPTLAEESSSSPAATTTTTTTEVPIPTSTSTTTLKPQDQKGVNKTENGDESNSDDVKSSQACNHLPSYDSDELQKVFREETTFKNGTIKGKFTYINFDQRYRLVHYTRLPYGPVKIDLVEELGRPESSNQSSRNNQTQLTPMSAIPNAVLQLRNILPNSLFGFPFLGPQTGSGSSNGIGRPQQGAVEESDKSNTYFYTTDTISTPNLLSPSVPVSVPPTGAGQRRIVPQQPSLDSSNSFANSNGQQFEQQNANDVLAALHKYRQQERANGEAVANMFGVPNHQQFQYAVSQPQGVQSPDPKQPGFIYSYLAQPQYQYQYSAQSAPLYSFQQPAAYYPPSSQQVQTSSYAINVDHGHHHHQPHSHEHFVAPFMFAQPPVAPGGEQKTEPVKVKLVKVKTSKALNVDTQQQPIGKSAQFRNNPSNNQGIYSAPANSPAHVGRRQHQFRHRHGKQNSDLKQTVNTTPVVYHVLRSPMGRMYNLPQYQQQAHAVAYDHDN